MYLPRKRAHLFYLLVDIFFIALSFSVPYYLRYGTLFPEFKTGLYKEYLLVFSFWGSILIFNLNNYLLYSTDRSLAILSESWKVAKAVFFSSIWAALAIFLFQINLFSRNIFFISASSLVLTLSSWRVVKRICVRNLILSGKLSTRVLLVGVGPKIQEVVDEIKNSPFLGLEVLGVLDDNREKKVNGLKILGKISDVEDIVKRNFVEELIVTDVLDKNQITVLAQKARCMNISLRLVVDNFELAFDKVMLNYIGYFPLITFHQRVMHGTEMLAKRLFDMIASSLTLFVLSPFLLIIAVLIKLDSPGPVFYISKRCSKNGRLFDFYKFRSMKDGSHALKEHFRCRSDVSGPVFKIKRDPRITRVGRFIRKYSIDELPQLFNVVKGDMSLVGPRPPTPDEVEKYEFWQMQRLNITPGITCLWQTRGRSELSFYKWMKLDLWYINNWSFGLDLVILLKTIPAVIRGKGAY